MVSPVVATVLLLGILGVQAALAAQMVASWCPLCVDKADTFHGGDPWTYCNGHQFQTPSCDHGAPVFQENPEGTVWCHLQISQTVVHTPQGISLEPVETIVCTLVKTLTDATA